MKTFGELSREEQVELFVAWLDGKTIEHKTSSGCFVDIHMPTWHRLNTYRVALIKPTINWDHVHPDYNWLATDCSGDSYVYNEEPIRRAVMWTGELRGSSDKDCLTIEAKGYASFKAGTCDWKDSLVKRLS